MVNSTQSAPLVDKGGRRVGSKNRKTLAKAKAVLDAAAGVLPPKLPAKARDGIDPLDLLLESMRSCWENAHRLRREAQALHLAATKLPQGPEKAEKLAEAEQKVLASQGQMSDAKALAVQAAPYKHARLANTDVKVAGNLTVELAKF